MSRVIQNYYDKFLKKEYNFHGLFLYPKMIGDKILWYHKNPENKSFSLNAVEGFAQEKFHDYTKFIGDYDYYRLYNKSVCIVDHGKVGKGKLYISKEDKIRFENACQDITDMEFRGMYFDFSIVDLELDNSFNEDFYIGCKINFTKGINIRKGEYYKTYDTIKEQLCEILIHDDFRDYEYQLFNLIGQIIYNNPLLFDNDYMYITYDIIAYSEGKKIMCY